MRSLYALAASLSVFLAAASPAKAINIVPVFNAADNETPAFDLFNGGIQDLFDYAETYYQDIFEDPGYTLTVNYWYEDLQDNYLGLFNPVTTVGNRVVEANVRIDTRVDVGGSLRNWYIDANPASDAEFNMEKVLWDNGFGVSLDFVAPDDPPEAFEVGYSGVAVDGTAAESKFDMLSTVLHEIGHALGTRGGATHENDDYVRWQSHFGNSLPGSGALAAVPEPCAAALIAIFAAAVPCAPRAARRVTRRS